jgi:hypothetical protein
MELEKFIIKRIKETTNWGWIVSLDGDVIDIMVPDGYDLKTANEGLDLMIELFTSESGYAAKPIKYKLWDRNEELSGLSDPAQQTHMAGIYEAMRNSKAAHELRKNKGNN